MTLAGCEGYIRRSGSVDAGVDEEYLCWKKSSRAKWADLVDVSQELSKAFLSGLLLD